LRLKNNAVGKLDKTWHFFIIELGGKFRRAINDTDPKVRVSY